MPHEFVGTDIDPSNFPKRPATHQTYQAQDITKPWPAEWKESFDLVHQRLALVAGGPIQKQCVSNLGAMVKPGGWIQLIEATNEPHESHGPAFRNFLTIMNGLFSHFKSSPNLDKELPEWLCELGFMDVGYKDLHLKLGALHSNPQLAKQGVYSTTIAARGLAQYVSSKGADPCILRTFQYQHRCVALPEGTIPLKAEQITSHPDELKVELANAGAIYTLRVVWGRKPTY